MSRRSLSAAFSSPLLVAASGVPAQAAESGGSEIAKGSFGGLALAAVMGLVFGVLLTIHAYRRVRFGEARGHQELAHDIREGMSSHHAPEPDVDEMPSGGP